ncbi:MAG: hypothetical protein WCV73_02115 [Patescibacteria group bacterium]|jgi:hypothetical protein
MQTTKNKEEIINKILNIIETAKREQIAYDVPDCEGALCFDLDFSDITQAEKYKIGGIALHVFGDYVKKRVTKVEQSAMLKIGQDVMLGSFLAARLGHKELSDEITRRLLEARLGLLKENKEFNFYELLDQQFTEYLEFCQQYDSQIALERGVV